jgi:predicted ATPase
VSKCRFGCSREFFRSLLEDDTFDERARLKPPQQAPEGVNSDARFRRVVNWIHIRLGGWRLYHLHDTGSLSPMRKTAKLHDNGFLRADGSNLAAFPYFLRDKHIDSYDLIKRAVQRVTPFFDDFRLQPRRLEPDDIKLEWRHKSSDQDFDASSLPDGTLRFIALTTLFLQPEQLRPSVILVDEPELAGCGKTIFHGQKAFKTAGRFT